MAFCNVLDVRLLRGCVLCLCRQVFSLQPSLLRIAVISSVGDYQMVEKVQAHYLARLLHALRQPVVVAARHGVVARMVVA